MCSDVHPNPGPVHNNEGNHQNLRLCNLNIHSVKTKGRFEQVKKELGPNFDIICMSESWLKPTIPDSDFKLDNFNGPHRLDRPEGKAGGVVVWVRNTIVTKRIKSWEKKGLELLWLELRTSNHKFLLGTAYRQPGNESKSSFWEDLQVSLSLAYQAGIPNIILTGDFNADISTNKTAGEDLSKFLSSNSMYQHVTKPTRITDETASILDLVITNHSDLVKDTDVIAPIHGSDHSTVIATLAFKTPKTLSYKRTMWDFKNSDFDKYRDILGKK
jgi:hypothetical protein